MQTTEELENLFNELATEGICNEAQWIAFIKKHGEMLLEKGIKVPPQTEEYSKAFYENVNKWSQGTDGLSVGDFWKYSQLKEIIISEIMAGIITNQEKSQGIR